MIDVYGATWIYANAAVAECGDFCCRFGVFGLATEWDREVGSGPLNVL